MAFDSKSTWSRWTRATATAAPAPSEWTLDPIIEFNDFLDTLDPAIRERYRTEHYALQDEDEETFREYLRRLKAQSPKDWKAASLEEDFNVDDGGIPYEVHGAIALPYKWYKVLRCQFLVSGLSFIQCGYIRGSVGLHHERFLQLISFPYVIHPYSNFFWFWNLLTCILLTVALIYEPYLIAFQCLDFASASNKLFSLFVSITMLFDAFLLFRVGYKDLITSRAVLDPVMIKHNYLHGKFWYNVLTRFPIDSLLFLVYFSGANKKIDLTLVRLVSFPVKLMRFEKIHWFMHELTLSFNMKSWSSQIAVHGILVLFCMHWGACLHWLLPDITNAYYFEKYSDYKEDSWITQMHVWDEPAWLQYLHALLRAIGNILCLDGGNYIPREFEEIFATATMILASMSVVGYFVSTFATMTLGGFRNEGDRFNEAIGCIQEYLRFRKIPLWLRERVMAYYDGKFRGQTVAESVLFSTLSGTLHNQILQHNCKHLLEKVYLFADLPKPVMQNLLQRLKYEVYIPGDVILSPHVRRECMYFIDEGYFAVLNEFGASIQLLEPGDCFGEVDLLCPHIPRNTSVVTLGISHVYILSKTEYSACMNAHPKIHEKILSVANERLEMYIKQIERQINRIDKAKRWKEVVLQQKRTVEEYYADMDSGVVPSYHIPPAALQRLLYVNYKRGKLKKRQKAQAQPKPAKGTETQSTFSLSEIPSSVASNV